MWPYVLLEPGRLMTAVYDNGLIHRKMKRHHYLHAVQDEV